MITLMPDKDVEFYVEHNRRGAHFLNEYADKVIAEWLQLRAWYQQSTMPQQDEEGAARGASEDSQV